jgi:hypothetical protein
MTEIKTNVAQKGKLIRAFKIVNGLATKMWEQFFCEDGKILTKVLVREPNTEWAKTRCYVTR